MLLRVLLKLGTIILTVIALIFFVALLIEMGQGGGLESLPSALPEAGNFAVEYLKNLAHGDMGAMASPYGSVAGTPVTVELVRALPKSVGLLAISTGLAIIAGLCLGMAAALQRRTPLSGFVLFLSTLGISTPSYFAAMLLIWFGVWLFEATGTHWFPIGGFGWDAHIILPALVLAARPAAAVTRLAYNALIETMDADYVRTAHSKGLAPRSVLVDHVLRNAGVPILTTIVVSLRFSLAVLPIVEFIFSWPGIGLALLTAIQVGDTVGTVGMISALALLFVVVNAFLGFLYPLLDPRLKTVTAGVQ